MSKTKKLTSRQQQAIDSKAKLTSTAWSLFTERGYNAVTIQDICSSAGMSVGVFYHYFKHKNDVMREIQQQKTAELLDFIDRESLSVNHIDALLELFSFVTRQQSEGPFDLVCTSFSPSLRDYEDDPRELKQLLCDTIESGQAVGELISSLPAETIADDLLTISRGFVFHWCELGGTFDLIPAHRGYMVRVLRAYAGPEANLPNMYHGPRSSLEAVQEEAIS